MLEVLENGVSKYPGYDGRFPGVSGLRFTFDGTQAPGSRVDISSVIVGGEPLDKEKDYSLSCKAFIGFGKDGYDVLKTCPRIKDEHHG